MSQVATRCHTLGGNSKSPSEKDTKARRWCFTLNNYTEDEYATLLTIFGAKNWKYIIGREKGELGTPHLQGYIETNTVRFSTLKNINNRIHWEQAKGTKEENYKYCSKDNNYIQKGLEGKQIEIMRNLKMKYENVKWRKWQEEVLDILESEPDERTIYWFHDHKGGCGKSFLTKYIALHYECIIGSGKKNDVFNQINTMINVECKEPRVIVLDIPRDNIDYIHYGTIEEIKNGCIYSGKYEGGRCLFNNPHVIIFANTPPRREKMSADRWFVREIYDDIPLCNVLNLSESETDHV